MIWLWRCFAGVHMTLRTGGVICMAMVHLTPPQPVHRHSELWGKGCYLGLWLQHASNPTCCRSHAPYTKWCLVTAGCSLSSRHQARLFKLRLTQIPGDDTYSAYHKRKPCTWAAYFDHVNWVHVIKVISHEVTSLGWQGSDLPAGHSCPLSSCCYLHAWVVGHCDLAAGSAWLLYSVSRFLALPATTGEEALANHGPFCFWTQYVSKTWKSNNKLV